MPRVKQTIRASQDEGRQKEPERRIRHVLVIPAEGDPRKLLEEGPCGTRPPAAFLRDGVWVPHGPVFPANRGDTLYTAIEKGDALVLAWEGESVPEGCDRITRVIAADNMIPTQRLRYSLLRAFVLSVSAATLGCKLVGVYYEDEG